jgi:C-terminal processing protease CtpA/Prc
MRVEAADDGAIIVRDLVDGYPAAAAGLASGDRVLAVDGLETDGMSVDTFVRLVRGEPGASVELVVANDTSTRSVVVARESYTVERSVCDVRRSLARETEFGGIGIRLSRCDGGVIRSVEAGGPAELAGLAAGDRILSVDGHDAEGADMWALVNAIRGVAGTPVTLDVEGADGLERSITVVRVAFVVPEATGCGQ